MISLVLLPYASANSQISSNTQFTLYTRTYTRVAKTVRANAESRVLGLHVEGNCANFLPYFANSFSPSLDYLSS